MKKRSLHTKHPVVIAALIATSVADPALAETAAELKQRVAALEARINQGGPRCAARLFFHNFHHIPTKKPPRP